MIAIVLLILAVGGTMVVGLQLLQIIGLPPEEWPIDLGVFGVLVALLLLVCCVGALGYRVAAVLTLRYALDRNGLYIDWLGNRAVIPLDRISSVDIGATVEYLPLGPGQAIGYYWGQARLAGGRTLHLFSTLPPERSLIVTTDEASYALAPLDLNGFVSDLEQRRNLGATKPLSTIIEPSRMFFYAFWNDQTVRALLLVALFLNLLALALIANQYPLLAGAIEMRFDATGETMELRPRHQVLFLPLAAFGLSLLNTLLGLALYHRERLAARLLQGASVIVQILFLIAVVSIIS
ncbi:MAG TPA: PH domain-containing protein [Roseiflexaceae bacterium]|nr:PH domain-containing protein [Roseiflexaceae bacterium]